MTKLDQVLLKMIRGAGLAVIPLCLATLMMFTGCTEGPLENEYGTWNFSGYVVDGSTQARLSEVKIIYLDNAGDKKEAETDGAGKFFISSLPFGDRSFEFEYEDSESEVRYTSIIVVASSYNESRSIDGLVGDVSKVIPLYPLSGEVAGEIYLKVRGSEKAVPAESLSVKVFFDDTNMVNASPSKITAVTDDNGTFKIKNVPAAPGAMLACDNFKYNGKVYTLEPVEIASAVGVQRYELGKVFLEAKDTTDLLISSVESNVLTDDGFGKPGVPVDETLWYLLPVSVTKSTVAVTISTVEMIECDVAFRGDTILVDPFGSLPADTLITVQITCQAKDGDFVSLLFDGARRFSTASNAVNRIRSNVLSNDGYGLADVPVNKTLWYILPETPEITGIEIRIDDRLCTACTTYTRKDTLFINPKMHFPFDSLITVSIKGVDEDGNHLEYIFDGIRRFHTEYKGIENIVSNVISSGSGKDRVPVDVRPWFVLPSKPLSATVSVTFVGGGSPLAEVTVSGDTVFAEPYNDFGYNSVISTFIKGTDVYGNDFEYLLEGMHQFRTESNIRAVASNTWTTTGEAQKYFKLNDTLWVVFSGKLDPDVNKFKWSQSSAMFDIYGSGAVANADAWVHGDTLFVRPDQRIAVTYGSTFGYSVRVVDENGKYSDSVDVVGQVTPNVYYVKWTNTKDNLGNTRQDFGLQDSIVIISNMPIKEVKGVSGNGSNNTPADLSLDNVTLKGDTLIYKPSQALSANSMYGIDFDILFKDGTIRYNALWVSWKTEDQD